MKAEALVKGDVVEVEHDGETYTMEVESNPVMDKTACSILLLDDDLRVFKLSVLRNTDITVVRESFLRGEAAEEETVEHG